MNLLNLVVNKDEVPIQEIGGELKPGMTKVFFPAETKRFVHVSRPAIIRNVKDGKNHPTVVVIDENGKKYNYHAVILRGPSALKYDSSPESVEANVFLVTKAGIEGYTDPAGDPPVMEVDVIEPPAPRVSLWKRLRLGERWHAFWSSTPIVGCMMYDNH